jgi:hypothetical protein
MTQSGDDGRYEAPVDRVAGSGAGERRARIAAVMVVVVLGSAIGLAIVPGLVPTRPNPLPSSRLAVPAPTARATSNRVEALVDLPDRAIPAAPRPVLIERQADDARLVRWTTGQGLAEISTIPGVFAGLGGVPFLARSPASDRLFVLSIGTGDAGDHGRLVDASGTILWEDDGFTALPGAVWSPDGQTVVAATPGRQWWIVTIRGGVPTARLANLPGSDGSDTAAASDLPGPLDLVPRTVPLGFSRDGQWIYGAAISPQLATLMSEFRISTFGDRAETVTSFRVGRPDGLATRPGTIGARIVDPSTGRIADWRTNSDFAGGPPTIQVRDADGAFAFVVDTDSPLGSAWGADGSLYVLTADTILFPERTALVRVAQDGAVGDPIFETGPVGGAALVGVWNGFAALGVTVGRPSPASQLVLVDLADPTKTAAIQLPADDGGSFIAADLAP